MRIWDRGVGRERTLWIVDGCLHLDDDPNEFNQPIDQMHFLQDELHPTLHAPMSGAEHLLKVAAAMSPAQAAAHERLNTSKAEHTDQHRNGAHSTHA